MDFSRALLQIKIGQRLTRDGWNGKGMWVALKPGYPDGIEASEATARAHSLPAGSSVTTRPYLEMWTADGQIVPWVASQTDILADDWSIILSDRAPLGEGW